MRCQRVDRGVERAEIWPLRSVDVHRHDEDDDVGLQIPALAILSHRFPWKHGRTDHPGPDQIGVMFSGPQYARMLFNLPESANWKTVMQLTRFEPTLAR